MIVHDSEYPLRELMRTTPLEPPLRADLPERVQAGARRRRRWQQAGAALCVVLAAAAGAVVARVADGQPGGTHPISGRASCAGTVVTATAGSQRVALPGQGAHQLTVQLGDSVRFHAVGPCSAQIALTSHSKNLVSRTSSFPSTGDLVADASKPGVEMAQVTVTDCPSFGGAGGCTDPTVVIVVGVITVQITSGPTP
jgi:hypothetical protein